MIKLIIDGMRVNLAADVSLEFYNRNPFFTSEGQHTLDIDISLDDPQNATVYKNIHRIDVARRPQNRSAVLYHEKGVIISGTEVILEIDSKTAKIQIVAGNSEFNFISGSDKHLHELDLGSIPTVDETTALASLQGNYPDWDYVCTPVCAKVSFMVWYENVMKDGFSTYDKAEICNEIEPAADASALTFKSGTRFCPQPYLAAMVRRVLVALGYNLVYDYIGNHKELSKLILVHSHDTLNYNMMVENWTVEKFFSEVENLCAVCLVVDNFTKEVMIMNAADYYTSADTEYIESKDVIGGINKKYDQDPPENIVYHNVSYNFPDTSLYKFYSLSPELMEKIEVVDATSKAGGYDWYYPSLYEVYLTIVGNEDFKMKKETPQVVKDAYNKMVAYRLPLSFTSFPYRSVLYVLAAAADSYALVKAINQFGPRIEEGSDDDMQLDIVPVEIVWCYRSNISAKGYLIYPLPLAQNSDSEETASSQDEEMKLMHCIHGDEKNVESVKDNLYVAFYVGVRPDVRGKGFVTPMCINSRLMEFALRKLYTDDVFWQCQYMNWIEIDGNFDLSINGSNGMYNTYWKNQIGIDFSEVYVIRFRSLKLRDARHIFNICNRRFYCQQLKYEVVNGHLSDVVEGTFYPLT